MSFHSGYYSGITIFDDEYWEEEEDRAASEDNEEGEVDDTVYKSKLARDFIVDNYIDFLAFLVAIKHR